MTQAETKYLAKAELVTGVVPLDGGETPVFAVDQIDGFGLRQARTLGSKKRWAVGTSGDSLAASSIDGRVVELWRRPDAAQLQRPDTAGFDARRHAIAFRSQEAAAVVRFGVFDVTSGKRWGFTTLPFTGRDIGRPAVASNGKYAAVAAAVAPTSGEPWRIQTVLLDRDAELLLQAPLTFLPYPRVVDQISPKLAPLNEDRWLLQWTEGEALARKIQVLVLDDNLKPVGEPRTISPARINAGGGQILGGETPVSVYLSQTAEHYDAWVQALDCR
jgi:hypothetical protein